MDHDRFDAVIRVLGTGASRRGLLAVVAGAAGLELTESAAKRRGQRKKRRRGAKRRVQAAGNDNHKVSICHRTGSKKKPFQVITIAESAVAAHAAHGDLVGCPDGEELDLTKCTCECVAIDPNPACDPRCDCGKVCKVFPNSELTDCCRYTQRELTNQCNNGGDFSSFLCQEACDHSPEIAFAELVPCVDKACGSDSECDSGSLCLESECCGHSVCVQACGPDGP